MKKIALGLMAVVLGFSAMAQTTDSSTYKNNGQQKEYRHKQFKGGDGLSKLNLTDDQKAQVKTINESFRQQMKDLRSQGNITVDEQKQKREALMKDHREKIAAVLTPEQKEQMKALRKDHKGGKDGAHARSVRELTKDLNLTPDQSAQMSSLNSAFKNDLQSVRQNTSLTQDEKREQMKSMMKKHRLDVEALLTDDQKAELKNHQKNRPDRTAVK